VPEIVLYQGTIFLCPGRPFLMPFQVALMHTPGARDVHVRP
jgi:hypothetical protein